MSEQFKLIDDNLISYDGDYFDLNKSSDKRSLVNVMNYLVNENNELENRIRELEHDV